MKNNKDTPTSRSPPQSKLKSNRKKKKDGQHRNKDRFKHNG